MSHAIHDAKERRAVVRKCAGATEPCGQFMAGHAFPFLLFPRHMPIVNFSSSSGRNDAPSAKDQRYL